MLVNCSGFLRASMSRALYFTWLLKLLIRELKMYLRLWNLKNVLHKILTSFDIKGISGLIQKCLKSTIELIWSL